MGADAVSTLLAGVSLSDLATFGGTIAAVIISLKLLPAAVSYAGQFIRLGGRG